MAADGGRESEGRITAAAGVRLLGIVIALPLFVFAYCRVSGKEKLWVSGLMAVIAFLLVQGLFEIVFKVRRVQGALFGG